MAKFITKGHKLRKVKVYDKKGTNFEKIKVYDKKSTNFEKIKVYNKNGINFCGRAIKYLAEGCAFGGGFGDKFI